MKTNMTWHPLTSSHVTHTPAPIRAETLALLHGKE